MAFNISTMISKGLRTGIAKTSDFEVMINPPKALGGIFKMTEELSFRADSVEIPGRTAMTIDQRFSMNGPINKVPYAQVYPDVTITFLLSEDMGEKKYMELWQSKMMDTEPNFGVRAGEDRISGAFNVKYFDDYKSTVDIKQYDRKGQLQNTIKLFDSYPIIINGVQMGWGDDAIARLSVQFALRYYTMTKGIPETVEKTETPKKIEKTGFSGTIVNN